MARVFFCISGVVRYPGDRLLGIGQGHHRPKTPSHLGTPTTMGDIGRTQPLPHSKDPHDEHLRCQDLRCDPTECPMMEVRQVVEVAAASASAPSPDKGKGTRAYASGVAGFRVWSDPDPPKPGSTQGPGRNVKIRCIHGDMHDYPLVTIDIYEVSSA